MKELSPQAQAVMEAYWKLPTNRAAVAAALRAAADQVVPEADTVDAEEWIGQSAWQQAEQSVRFRFLAIAVELEAGG